MTDYMRQNPYQAFYRNLNLQVTQHITKQNAEEIARHLGFLHNAFGLVAKDLIKMLSFKFPPEGSHLQENPQKIRNEKGRGSLEQKQKGERHKPEMMDIQHMHTEQIENQNLNRPTIIFSKKQNSPAVVQICDDDDQKQDHHQKIDKPQEKSPNYDFLGQFAYERSAHEQTKVNILHKTNNLLKDHMSKIFEKVSSKKKKESKNNEAPKTQQYKPSSPPPNPRENIPNSYSVQFSSNCLGPSAYSSKHLVESFSNNMIASDQQQNQKMAGEEFTKQVMFLQEYEFKNEQKKKPQHFLVQSSSMQNEAEIPNKLWLLMRQKSVVPQVFEISDDD